MRRSSVSKLLKVISEASVRFYILRFLCGYFSSCSSDDEYLTWLTLCNKEFPNNHYFIERLVEYYRSTRNEDHTIHVAEVFYDNNPNSADALLPFGRILEDKYPMLATKHLREAYEKSGSVECLSRIGRAYHNLWKYTEAAKTYWEVLDMNPLNVVKLLDSQF